MDFLSAITDAIPAHIQNIDIDPETKLVLAAAKTQVTRTTPEGGIVKVCLFEHSPHAPASVPCPDGIHVHLQSITTRSHGYSVSGVIHDLQRSADDMWKAHAAFVYMVYCMVLYLADAAYYDVTGDEKVGQFSIVCGDNKSAAIVTFRFSFNDKGDRKIPRPSRKEGSLPRMDKGWVADTPCDISLPDGNKQRRVGVSQHWHGACHAWAGIAACYMDTCLHAFHLQVLIPFCLDFTCRSCGRYFWMVMSQG